MPYRLCVSITVDFGIMAKQESKSAEFDFWRFIFRNEPHEAISSEHHREWDPLTKLMPLVGMAREPVVWNVHAETISSLYEPYKPLCGAPTKRRVGVSHSPLTPMNSVDPSETIPRKPSGILGRLVVCACGKGEYTNGQKVWVKCTCGSKVVKTTPYCAISVYLTRNVSTSLHLLQELRANSKVEVSKALKYCDFFEDTDAGTKSVFLCMNMQSCQQWETLLTRLGLADFVTTPVDFMVNPNVSEAKASGSIDSARQFSVTSLCSYCCGPHDLSACDYTGQVVVLRPVQDLKMDWWQDEKWLKSLFRSARLQEPISVAWMDGQSRSGTPLTSGRHLVVVCALKREKRLISENEEIAKYFIVADVPHRHTSKYLSNRNEREIEDGEVIKRKKI